MEIHEKHHCKKSQKLHRAYFAKVHECPSIGKIDRMAPQKLGERLSGSVG